LFIIFLEGDFLGVGQGEKNQGVAIGVDGSLGQTYHRVGMEAQGHPVPETQPQFLIGHHAVMGLTQCMAGDDPLRPA
jgi:hypothetical protein